MNPYATDPEWVEAYLEWMDETAGPSIGAAFEPATPDVLREAVLLMTLCTGSECVHILRQALDEGSPTSHTLELAAEALAQASNLLDDERRAWRALHELRGGTAPRERFAAEPDVPFDWPYSLERNMESDLRALSGRVLELRSH